MADLERGVGIDVQCIEIADAGLMQDIPCPVAQRAIIALD